MMCCGGCTKLNVMVVVSEYGEGCLVRGAPDVSHVEIAVVKAVEIAPSP